MSSIVYDYDEEGSSSNDEEEIEQELELADVSEEEEDSDDDEEPVTQTPSKRKGKRKIVDDDDDHKAIIVQTSFDAYFTYTASKIQTSTNVFSQLLLPLTAEEYAEGIEAASKRLTPLIPSLLDGERLGNLFTRFIFELKQGFNILCYGTGSKRAVLNRFASEVCSRHGHVVVANAFQPEFGTKDLLARIQSLPPLQDIAFTSNLEKQTNQIVECLSKQKHHLYIVIHNIDAPPLRSTRSKTVLGVLASSPGIHLIGSVDHINAPLLWSSSEMSSRKPTSDSGDTPSSTTRGYAWLWHDLTTLAPYDAELAYADRSSISGASSASRRKADASTAQNPTAMSETAASHILASVTQKAKKLFILLGKRQLESLEDAGDKVTNDLQQYGMAYDALFNAARDDFIAVNDTALRSLLGEFRDHGLVLSAPSGTGAETLWIPLRKERLQSVLNALEASS